MARVKCPPSCRDAPFPHIEVTTAGKIDPKTRDRIPGRKFILCADCGHDTNRERDNCMCSESCHISDLFDTES